MCMEQSVDFRTSWMIEMCSSKHQNILVKSAQAAFYNQSISLWSQTQSCVQRGRQASQPSWSRSASSRSFNLYRDFRLFSCNRLITLGNKTTSDVFLLSCADHVNNLLRGCKSSGHSFLFSHSFMDLCLISCVFASQHSEHTQSADDTNTHTQALIQLFQTWRMKLNEATWPLLFSLACNQIVKDLGWRGRVMWASERIRAIRIGCECPGGNGMGSHTYLNSSSTHESLTKCQRNKTTLSSKCHFSCFHVCDGRSPSVLLLDGRHLATGSGGDGGRYLQRSAHKAALGWEQSSPVSVAVSQLIHFLRGRKLYRLADDSSASYQTPISVAFIEVAALCVDWLSVTAVQHNITTKNKTKHGKQWGVIH